MYIMTISVSGHEISTIGPDRTAISCANPHNPTRSP